MSDVSTVSTRLAATGTANALELRGVSKMFGALAALSDIAITVHPGERRAVLGSNGAGKTTLFNCITGDFLPTTGTIRFFGEDIMQLTKSDAHLGGLKPRGYRNDGMLLNQSVHVIVHPCAMQR